MFTSMSLTWRSRSSTAAAFLSSSSSALCSSCRPLSWASCCSLRQRRIRSCSLLSSSSSVFAFHSSSICFLSSLSFSFRSLCSWFSLDSLLWGRRNKRKWDNQERPGVAVKAAHGVEMCEETGRMQQSEKQLLVMLWWSSQADRRYLHILQASEQQLSADVRVVSLHLLFERPLQGAELPLPAVQRLLLLLLHLQHLLKVHAQLRHILRHPWRYYVTASSRGAAQLLWSRALWFTSRRTSLSVSVTSSFLAWSSSSCISDSCC
ncbi:hypothetical protein EYF80_002842 [Liparis tanakae]|uniref:Uncharacterized protein n=1 Tax=Liparis tanakae TaxID=230148 RepID=A0A4Z2JAM4_9TELE|nr:hypothetical protein EYF80_002842 [Liparis tanakae]